MLKNLLFPHIAISIILFPLSVFLLIYSLGTKNPNPVITYASYVISAYTLTILCIRIPELNVFFKKLKNENKYIQQWLSNIGFRVNVSLYGGFIWNLAYAVLQTGLGITHKSFWFYSLAAYYFMLSIIRLYLARYTSKFKPGEHIKTELKKYRNCGIAFLFMNIALSLMIFFMVYWNRTFDHNEITTIALAAYTFTTLTKAVINVIKYRKYNSPVYSASKIVVLTSACVSLLTLESTMLNTFNDGSMTLQAHKILLGVSGAALSVFVICTAIYMIVKSTVKIKEYNKTMS